MTNLQHPAGGSNPDRFANIQSYQLFARQRLSARRQGKTDTAVYYQEQMVRTQRLISQHP
ncbi:hypothetical protein [Fibrella aquatilis]|uniref:Uncharacterized protein n=1 Tax=Fibrella aquatilis TaxID=2817059 RepID=A0A939G358_9BACT|nr:hypothetical protein [Fibrella aquatilis]MBO0930343.1 hypothetical protein [Fibrella aquatilis]